MDSYISFDEFGITEIRCMCCGEPVAQRTYVEVQSRVDPSKKEKVLAISRFSNWKQINVRLSDGTSCSPIVCTDCNNHPDPWDYNQLMDQVKRGWEEELKFAGKDQRQLKHLKHLIKNLKIIEEV
ncbi:MAG: hypothetical protein ABIL14_01390 [candidate division WOR-3 bacterium]